MICFINFSDQQLLIHKTTINHQMQFLEIVKNLQATPSSKLNPPKFIFKLNKEAAEFNANILSGYGFNLREVIKDQHPSQISFGSEFRSPNLLQELLCHHPLWERLRTILVEGAHFPLREIPDSDRLIDLNYHVDRGNHKSATVHSEVLKNYYFGRRGTGICPTTSYHRAPTHTKSSPSTSRLCKASNIRFLWQQNKQISNDPRPVIPWSIRHISQF